MKDTNAMKRHPPHASAPVPTPTPPLPVPPNDYQPTEDELEEEFDMPGLSLDQVRERFFRPFRFTRDR